LKLGPPIGKKRHENNGGAITVFGDKDIFFLPVDFYPIGGDVYQDWVLIGDLQTGEYRVLVAPEYTGAVVHPQNGLSGYMASSVPVEIEGDLCLSIFFADPNVQLYRVDWYLGLYNVDQSAWVYSKKPSVRLADGGGIVPHSLIHNNKVYEAFERTMVCHDLLTGELLWTKYHDPQPFWGIGFVADKLIAVSQDETIHCLDPETGNKIWELTKVTANPSAIRELNGIAYFTGGGGKFFAIDVDAGEVIWEFLPPEYSGAFMNGVRIVKGVDGEDDKVLVSSFTTAYCYRAAR